MTTNDVALLVISDRAASGERADETAARLRPLLTEAGFRLVHERVVPDDRRQIAGALRSACDVASLVLTTGGTGVGPRDVTPEATRDVIEMEIPGLGEEMRRRSVEETVKALGSRALGGVRGRSVIVNLPGRPEGAVASLSFVIRALPHLVALRQGTVPDAAHDPEPS